MMNESGLWSGMPRVARVSTIWVSVVAVVIVTMASLRFLALRGNGSKEQWQTRILTNANISLMAPGDFRSLSDKEMALPEKVRNEIARSDFYYFAGEGFDVMACRMQSRDSSRFPPPPSMVPSATATQTVTRNVSRPCMVGAICGTVVELRFKDGGEDLEGKSFVVASPPELWVISIRHLANDKKAGESAQRVADSIKINGQSVQMVESPMESLTGD